MIQDSRQTRPRTVEAGKKQIGRAVREGNKSPAIVILAHFGAPTMGGARLFALEPSVGGILAELRQRFTGPLVSEMQSK